MTTSRLTARLDKVALELDPQHRSMVVSIEDGETAEEALERSGVSWFVVVAPRPCATNEEWLLQLAPREGTT